VQARLAFGILLALGLGDLAVLNLQLAPQLAALPTDVPPPGKPPVAGEGTLTKPNLPVKPPDTAPLRTSVAPPPTATAVAEVSTSASSAPSPSGTPVLPTATVEPTAAVTVAPTATAVAETPRDRNPPSSTPGEAVPDIVFELDASVIPSASARADLKAVAQKLARDPSKRLLIRGHSDQMGSPEYKRALSQRRAMTVQIVLVSHGAPADRITIEAVSDNDPADHRNNPVAWAHNRRAQVLWR
jgi:outer membrane protein OmpA-like peptidoglycan-associated protein